MTAPSNANTSGLTPTDTLRLDEAQRTAIEHAAMDANADVWRHCRLAMVADGEIVGYPCFSRADMAELARLYEAAPASPLPGGGWQDISTAPKNEGVKVMAFDGTKVGEAVLYGEWEESNDFEDAVLRWRWANDSCSCCWGKAEPQPTHWMPLPAAPTGEPK